MKPDEPRRCGAKTNSGASCAKSPVAGRTRCRVHGGATPSGPASPHWKHGRHSTALPGRLAGRYQEALADRELLNLTSEIALIDARSADVLGRVGTGESDAAWERLKATATNLRDARRDGNAAGVATAVNDLLRLIDGESNDTDAWQDVRQLVQERRRLVESERRRLVELQQYMTTEQVLALVGAVAALVRGHVTDPHALTAISAGLARLTGAWQPTDDADDGDTDD